MTSHHHAHESGDIGSTDPREYWEARYADSPRVWSGRPNATLVDVVGGLGPDAPQRGTALDLGCGEGADAIWLAQQGWRTTGIDISTVALARAREAADALGLAEPAVRFVAADLSTWDADGDTYDLVTASFLQSSVELPRIEILRRAARAVAAGGHLLVVTHAEAPPWAEGSEHMRDLPSPAEDLVALDLTPADWDVVLAEPRARAAATPDGDHATLVDGALLLRRH